MKAWRPIPKIQSHKQGSKSVQVGKKRNLRSNINVVPVVFFIAFCVLNSLDLTSMTVTTLSYTFDSEAPKCSAAQSSSNDIDAAGSKCQCRVPVQWTSQAGQDSFLFERIFRPQGLCCTGGMFVEFGARNGISDSNTFGFETCMGWKGLLFEMDPREFVDLEKNRPEAEVFKGAVCSRGVHSINVVMSHIGGLSGPLDHYEETRRDLESNQTTVKCYDLAKELRTRSIYTVDYMTIDTEGSEVILVLDFPWDDFDIRVVQIEQLVAEKFPTQAGKKEKVIDHMISHNYVLYEVYTVAEFDTEDLIFVRNLPDDVVVSESL